MKVIKGTQEELQNLADSFDALARTILSGIGRTIDEYGNLVNLKGGVDCSTVTNTFVQPVEDSVQGWYLQHPDKMRGRWTDEYIESLVDLIPESLEIEEGFTPTIEQD